MKKIWLLFPCILLLILISCDRKTSKKERLEHAISEFNKNQNLRGVKNYYPESYTEIKTDSIISNTFKVSIKNYVSSEAGILIKKPLNDVTQTAQYHRVFESDIVVAVADKIVFEKHISVAKFKAISASKFWDDATLEHVWVNQDTSNTDKLSLAISFINPKHQTYKLFEMEIDKSGNERLTLIEDHS